jgi:putative chitinase
MEFREKYKSLLESFYINTKLRYNHLMTQLEHESNLKPVREDTYYTTIKQAKEIFYTPFKGKTNLFVSSYLRNSEKMANYVYANRMGNGDEESGDGWKYRAGGFIGITGKNNFTKLSKDTKIDYLKNPELLETEADALISSLWYWKVNNLNKFADLNDLDSISDIVNIGRQTQRYGDANGFKDRKEIYERRSKLD